MLTYLKSLAIAALFFQIIISRLDIIPGLIIVAELASLINASSINALQLLKKNIFILSFSVFFGFFAVISGVVNDNLNINKIVSLILKIIITFNCIYSGIKWIETKELMQIINKITSPRINLFLLFFIKTIEYFIRTHNKIINQLKVRLNLNYTGKYLVARYYVQNLLYKELYAFHHHQSAFYTRISEIPELYIDNKNARFKDIIALFMIFAGTCVYIILQ